MAGGPSYQYGKYALSQPLQSNILQEHYGNGLIYWVIDTNDTNIKCAAV